MKLYSNNYTLKTISTHKTIFKNTNISNSNVPTIITKIKFKNIPDIRVASAASVRRPGALRAAPPAKPGSRAGAARGASVRAAGGAGGRRRGAARGRRRGRSGRAAALGERARAVLMGRTLPPVETAVGAYRRIIRHLPPFQPAVRPGPP